MVGTRRHWLNTREPPGVDLVWCFQRVPLPLYLMDVNKPDETMPPGEGAMLLPPDSTNAWQRVGTNTIIGGAVRNPLSTELL